MGWGGRGTLRIKDSAIVEIIVDYGKHGEGTHCTKMGAESSAENAPEVICPICLPNPKVLDFNEKGLHWASIVSVRMKVRLCTKVR